ncbi:hypothetical protein B0A48_04594 [Cryoendolithus antarcticus]|uniref:F-box domain-containing protein n=1 Tax=Cryoendolithus antarcticus TaxID=1507870 RepID=A0A1V8TFT4_9PEZI|nr:hypothetical protein B0A48_04594 [Cryoendolithus antarcticus]
MSTTVSNSEAEVAGSTALLTALAISATIEVFTIPEPVDEILFHVCMKDILFLQRTSKVFDRTMRYAPRLQEKLFFRPIKLAEPRQRGLLLDMAADSHVNNLLLSLLGVQCRRYRCKLGRNAANIEGITMGYEFTLHYKRPRERRKHYMPGSWETTASNSRASQSPRVYDLVAQTQSAAAC